MNSNLTILSRVTIFLTPAKVFFILFILGNIVFINSWGNSFIYDDISQIVTNQTIHSLHFIPAIFLNHTQVSVMNGYYRPVTTTVTALLYSFFHNNSFFYHYFQILLYISNAMLLYILLKRFCKQGIAFFLSVLFLVHPMNEETVVYIANLQDVLFVFFGLSAIVLLIKNIKNRAVTIFVYILLLLSILSKETGVLFIVMTLFYQYSCNRKNKLLHTIASICVGSLYLAMRILYKVPVKEPITPIMHSSFVERVTTIPAIILYYIRELFFPYTMVAINSWIVTSRTFSTFYMPLIIDCLFLLAFFIFAYVLYKKNQDKGIVLFFLLWFLLGLLVHMQLIPLDFTVADRFFYFPFIGLLGLIGLFFQYSKVNKYMHYILLVVGICMVLLLSIRTIVRNQDWKNQLILFSHDEPLSQNDFTQELVYGGLLLEENNYTKAAPHVKAATALYPQSYQAWNNLGLLYYHDGNIVKAKEAWVRSMLLGKPYGEYSGTYENMAMLLLKYESPIQAKNFLRLATNMYPLDAHLWFDSIIADYLTHDNTAALYASKQYFILQRDSQSYNIYLRLLQKRPLEIKL